MTSGPDIHDLARHVAVMEKSMETMQAEYRTDIARLAETMAQRDAEAARRDKDNLRWTVGFGIAQTLVTVAILGAGLAFLGILLGS